MKLDPALRRANILVSGIDLEASKGRTLRLGSIWILVRGETKPCNIMEETCPGLKEALQPHWRGGVYGEVLEDGAIRVGDAVAWVDDESSPTFRQPSSREAGEGAEMRGTRPRPTQGVLAVLEEDAGSPEVYCHRSADSCIPGLAAEGRLKVGLGLHRSLSDLPLQAADLSAEPA